MLQVEAKFGADLQLIKDIDIKGTGEIFKETQTKKNSRQVLWLCKALGTVCSVPQVKTIFLFSRTRMSIVHLVLKKVAIWPVSENLGCFISTLLILYLNSY